jgi:hypothetical protein
VPKLKPVFGYLHRNHEMMAESATYLGSMPYTDLLGYFCSMTNYVHRKSSTSLQRRSKDFTDYVSRRSNACRVVLRGARVLDVRWKRRLARSPIPTGTPNQSTRVRVSGKTLAAITVLGSPRNWIAVNNSTDIGFNTNQQPKEMICEHQK